jgi:hypothetical protein
LPNTLPHSADSALMKSDRSTRHNLSDRVSDNTLRGTAGTPHRRHFDFF